MDYPLDREAELLKWGPVPVQEYYGDIFQGLITGFANAYPGYYWPKPLVMYRDGKFIWIEEQKAAGEMGAKIFLEKVLPKQEREAEEKKWRIARDALTREDRLLDATDLVSLSNEEFRVAWDSLHTKVADFWTYSTLFELANYGSMPLLEAELKKNMPEEDLVSVMEVLTAPEEFSFYQQEEIELAETEDIEAHQKKYFWLANSYAHVEVMPVERFQERKEDLSPTLRTEAIARIEDVRKRKAFVIEKYALPSFAMEISEGICAAISLQDDRKKGNWQYMHYFELLLKEAARRYGFDINSARKMFVKEIENLMDGHDMDIEARDQGHGFVIDGLVFAELTSEQVEAYWKAYVEVQKQNVAEFRGTVACKGSGAVRGTVRIITDPRVVAVFNKGDILVTQMTTPDYVQLMKLAGAIVTDTGGLMSHAAVVSREFNVPCIVGTKIATGALKDGDAVEVDAARGFVKKL